MTSENSWRILLGLILQNQRTIQIWGCRVAVLYVKEQGAIFQKSLLEMPIYHIEHIMVIGNVQVTSQALQILLQSGVDVTYLTFSGKYLGHTAAETSKNIFLRLAQYEIYQNMEERLELAKQIVKNKMDNQKELIKKWRWEKSDLVWK